MTYTNVLTGHGAKLKSGEIVPFFAISSKRLPDYPILPAMTEFGGPNEKTLMQVYASTGTIGRALAFPPGVPADRLAALRSAFDRMIADPDFKADVAKTSTPIQPMTGDALANYVAGVMTTPSSQIEAARGLHQELLKSK